MWESKDFCSNYPAKVLSGLLISGLLSTLFDLMKFVPYLSHSVNTQWREHYFSDLLLEKNKTLSYIHTFKTRLFPNLVWWDYWFPCFDTSVNEFVIHSRSLLYKKAKFSALICLQIFKLILQKFSILLKPVGLFKVETRSLSLSLSLCVCVCVFLFGFFFLHD